MGRIDHDVRTKLLANRTGRGLARVGGTKNVADLLDGIVASINECKAANLAFRRYFIAAYIRRPLPGHELHDAVELVVAERRPKGVGESALHLVRHLEIELLLQGLAGAVNGHATQFFAQDRLHGSVEFKRFGQTHAVQLGSDDPQAGAGECIENIARPRAREGKVVGLDNHQCFLHIPFVGQANGVVEDPAVGLGKLSPQDKCILDGLRRRPHKHGGLEIGHGAIERLDVVAIGSADRIGTFDGVLESPNGIAQLVHSVFALEQQHQHTVALAVGGRNHFTLDIIGEQFPYLRPNLFVDSNQFGIAMCQLRAGAKHPSRHKIEPRPAQQPA